MTPATDPAATSISTLQDEISELRNSIRYLEVRILRKQIAIAEILDGREVAPEAEPAVVVQAPRRRGQGLNRSRPTVRQMIGAILPELNGDPFWYGDLKGRCTARWPDHREKIERGVITACYQMVRAGQLVKVPGGLVKSEDWDPPSPVSSD